MATRPRHALITGGSRGIGLAIAQLFAKNSYRCTLISRSESDLQAAVATLQPLPPMFSQYDSPSFQFLADKNPENTKHYTHGYVAGSLTAGLTSAKQFWSTSARSPLRARLGKPDPSKGILDPSRVDVLVNCAGVTQAKLFIMLDEAAIENIISTNLTSLMHGTKFLMRNNYLRNRIKEEGEGFSPVVINVSSLLGLQGGYGAVAYAASKAGVLGFTRALATEYAIHKVRVNAIVPGYVETDMTKGVYAPSTTTANKDKSKTQSTDLNTLDLQKRIPLGRFGTPQEIAHAALFLTENEYAHNCVVNLDGGLSAV
jgi:NAD(P)-dependent dehydrogenase (short-subunit alcohol dehydrogenase family)